MFRDHRRGQPPDLDDPLQDDEDLLEDDLDGDSYDEQPPPEKRRGGLGVALLGLVFGVVLSIGAIFVAASVGRAGSLAGGAFTILVLGTDQRPSERGGDPGRTDSMMLVSFGPAGVSMVSIPRDLWVPIPGHGEGRINTAYRLGELERKGHGPLLARRTVERALGVPIDRYVLVDMAGVREIVDRLGGVDVDNPTAIVDEEFPTDDYRTMTVTIPAGRQRLNGDLALVYARTRHQDSDFGRMGRQQQVIGAILAKMQGPTALLRAPGIVEVLQRTTRTDLTTADYVGLSSAVLNLSGDRVHRLVIGPELVTPLTGADGAALLQPTPGLGPAVSRFVSGRT